MPQREQVVGERPVIIMAMRIITDGEKAVVLVLVVEVAVSSVCRRRCWR